jgi:hypothetical protein
VPVLSLKSPTSADCRLASGLQLGYATLDSIRAVKQSTYITGISPNPITTINGYSGGAIAAAWVRLHLAFRFVD